MDIERKSLARTDVKVLDEEKGVIECVVSVTGLLDHVKDIIEPGAYTKTLKDRKPKMVWSHDWDKPIGVTESIEELLPGDPRIPDHIKTQGGGALLVKSRFIMGTQLGRESYEIVKAFGDDAEFSIGYNVPVGGATKGKDGVRHIKALDLFEYSPVLFGAMPHAKTVSLKSVLEHEMEIIEGKDVYTTMSTGATPVGMAKPHRHPFVDRKKRGKCAICGVAKADHATKGLEIALTETACVACGGLTALEGKGVGEAEACLACGGEMVEYEMGEEDLAALTDVELDAKVRQVKVRHVRTPEGSRLFKKPVGSPIQGGGPNALHHGATALRDVNKHEDDVMADAYVQGGIPRVESAVGHLRLAAGNEAARNDAGELGTLADRVTTALENESDLDDGDMKKLRKLAADDAGDVYTATAAAAILEAFAPIDEAEMNAGVDANGIPKGQGVTPNDNRPTDDRAGYRESIARDDAHRAAKKKKKSLPALPDLEDPDFDLKMETLEALLEGELEDAGWGDEEEVFTPVLTVTEDDTTVKNVHVTAETKMTHEPLGKPGNGENWVERAGQLPAYIQHIAKDLHEQRGMDLSHAIATAISRVKAWAAGGDNVKPDTRAKAVAAVAEWEALKAKSKAKNVGEDVANAGKKTLASEPEVVPITTPADPQIIVVANGEPVPEDVTLEPANTGGEHVAVEDRLEFTLHVTDDGGPQTAEKAAEAVIEDLETKSGRVLSTSNASKLKRALEDLVHVLRAAGALEPAVAMATEIAAAAPAGGPPVPDIKAETLISAEELAELRAFGLRVP